MPNNKEKIIYPRTTIEPLVGSKYVKPLDNEVYLRFKYTTKQLLSDTNSVIDDTFSSIRDTKFAKDIIDEICDRIDFCNFMKIWLNTNTRHQILYTTSKKIKRSGYRVSKYKDINDLTIIDSFDTYNQMYQSFKVSVNNMYIIAMDDDEIDPAVTYRYYNLAVSYNKKDFVIIDSSTIDRSIVSKVSSDNFIKSSISRSEADYKHLSDDDITKLNSEDIVTTNTTDPLNRWLNLLKIDPSVKSVYE